MAVAAVVAAGDVLVAREHELVIAVVGLGPGPYGLLTAAALQAISSADEVVVRTARHPAVASLPNSVTWTACDDLYTAGRDYDAVYDAVVDRVLAREHSQWSVAYAVPGDPSFGEETVRRLVERAQAEQRELRIIPGVSFVGSVLASGPGAINGHLQILDALAPVEPNPLIPAVVYQVHDQPTASAVKLELLRLYPSDHPVTIARWEGAEEVARTVRLAEIDRETYDHLTSLYVPQTAPELAPASPLSLRAIVHRLRAPGGCPWDREQSTVSLVPYLIEEAHEAADAILEGDPHATREELGDVLLQVYLQAEIANEQADFDVSDVIRAISEKLVRRHPHVFGDVNVDDAREVQRNWELLKLAEKGHSESSLDRVPRSLPALARAQAIQRALTKQGFDWPSRKGSYDKLAEELDELQTALADQERAASELGDVLFMLAKLAADAGLDAEAALRSTIAKVSRRFQHVENAARARGTSVREQSHDEHIALWEEAKALERRAVDAEGEEATKKRD